MAGVEPGLVRQAIEDLGLEDRPSARSKSFGSDVVRPGPPGKRLSPVQRCGGPVGSSYSRQIEPGVWPTMWITSRLTPTELDPVAVADGAIGGDWDAVDIIGAGDG